MNTLSKQNNTHFYRLGLLSIFLLALLLRVYRLAEVPDALYADEAALGYNAWCLAHYGVDRYLNIIPIYPQNFDGGQSPLYTYCTVLLLAAFGKGGIPLFLVRLPGLISSMLAVVFGTKTIARIFQSRKLTLTCALILSICPYYIMHGRFALDCNLMLGCSTIALYCLVKYIQCGRLSQLIVCGVSFGVVLYSYALSYFVLPMFLCSMALYLLYTGKITIPRTFLWAVTVCITALPVILFIFCLLFDIPDHRFLCFTISPTASSRMDDVESSILMSDILLCIKVSLTRGFYPMDAVDKFYTLYPVSIPFVIIGIFVSIYHFIASIVKRTFHFSSIYVLFFLSSLITAGLAGSVLIYRVNYIFASYIYFIMVGISAIYHFMVSYKNIFLFIINSCYLLWGVSFLHYYFTAYSIPTVPTYVKFIKYLYFELAAEPIAFVEAELQPQEIYCDCAGRGTYYYFYVPVSPYELCENGSPDDNDWKNYHYTVAEDTPISSGCAYIVRKENAEFLNRLYQCDLKYDSWEYEYYYVFYCNDPEPDKPN